MASIEYSNAQSNRWYANIGGLPSIEYKLVDFTLPMLSVGSSDLGGTGDVSLMIPGDRLSIDQIQLDFFVDKRYLNYYHIYKWMRENLRRPDPLLMDITVMLLDNQGNPQDVSFVYKGCYPLMLAPIALDTSGATTDIMVGLTLQVSDFDVNIVAPEGTPSAMSYVGFEQTSDGSINASAS